MQNRMFATSIFAGALGFTLLTGAPATADSPDEDLPAGCHLETGTETVVISPERTEQRLVSPAVEPVIKIEYEYVHRDPENPNSPRWEPEGWNSDDNPESFGYASTGETRTVIVTPGVDAVYETVTIPAVAEEREYATVVCPATGGSDSTGGTDADTDEPGNPEPGSDEQDRGQEQVGSGNGAGNGTGTDSEAPLTTPAPVMAPVSGTTDQAGAETAAGANGQAAQQGAAETPVLTAEVGALAYTASVNAAPAAVAEASALVGTYVPAQPTGTKEQLAYTGASGSLGLILSGTFLAGGVSMVATSRLLTRRAPIS